VKVTADTEGGDKTLKQVVAETTEGAPAPNAANLDSETLERLASLGYIGAPMAVKPAGGSNTLVDPKDRLSVYEAIQKAGELNNGDQYAESARVLEQVLREDPANPQGRLLLASDYAELKRPQEAITILRALIEEDPKMFRPWSSYNIWDEGKNRMSHSALQSVIEVDDRNTGAPLMPCVWTCMISTQLCPGPKRLSKSAKANSKSTELAHARSVRSFHAEATLNPFLRNIRSFRWLTFTWDLKKSRQFPGDP
jgi:tetratricopeptide (TPR) repeat protein